METKVRAQYYEYLIYADAVPTADEQFSSEAQIASPSGFISFTALGTFKTAIAATDHAMSWVKKWIDSGIAEEALADAFKKLQLSEKKL